MASPIKPQYDTNFTDAVIASTGPKANPRLAQIMPSLLRHLHDFAREVDLTIDEWTAGLEMINKAGQMSDDKRNETQIICDILGLESLVDEITSKILQRDQEGGGATATPSAVLGPFYRPGAPLLPAGASIILPGVSAAFRSSIAGLVARMSGRVVSAGKDPIPIPGATIDLWQGAPNGLYEQQDPDQPDMNLRGRFVTASPNGRYELQCLRPAPYPVPDDGPAGELLALLDRHPWRPAHIHFIVSAPGYRSLTTQIFDCEDPRISDDAVFAVKDALVVSFKEVEQAGGAGGAGGEAAEKRAGDNGQEEVKWELDFDFVLTKMDE
ncbi:catechol 1,2-dioxygenase-like protein [Xylariales sp. PMI_506]|nr:catechol 1,2-dioxygenase-like protein [Xylariales sp. PMI_506]